MSWDNNVYYNPEKFGLEIVGELDRPDMSYEFDMFIVWKDASGNLFYASDSGCSCPSPFEDFNKIDDLYQLTNWDEFVKDVEEWNDGYGGLKVNDAEVNMLKSKVADLLPR